MKIVWIPLANPTLRLFEPFRILRAGGYPMKRHSPGLHLSNFIEARWTVVTLSQSPLQVDLHLNPIPNMIKIKMFNGLFPVPGRGGSVWSGNKLVRRFTSPEKINEKWKMKLNKKYWPPQVVIFNEKMVARKRPGFSRLVLGCNQSFCLLACLRYTARYVQSEENKPPNCTYGK